MLQKVNNKDADQTAQICRLVYAFVVHIHKSQVFLLQGPYNDEVICKQEKQSSVGAAC